MDINTYENPKEMNAPDRPALIEYAQKSNPVKSKRKFYDLDNWALISCRENNQGLEILYEKPVQRGTQLIGWQEIDIHWADIERDIQMNGHSHTRQSAEEFLRQREGIESGFELLDQ
ncbi:MAG: hypothetical protein LBN94_00125 [Puniceicoccales bacterium]|jgi:hypothetical protein|nr:hypothetical protein [Puniceicoccales bacterium]